MPRDLTVTVQTPKALSTTIDSLTSVWADVGGAASLGGGPAACLSVCVPGRQP